ncbi:MAG: hypothetical protein JWQ07_4073 [Ramlibacter sp.]|nr:hypothetical protein [Ramlibacter sp.]
MEEKLFGLTLQNDYFEVVKREDHYYVRYDAGSHQPIWREDEITAEDAQKIASGKVGEYQVLLALQKRLGPDAYKSNWTPTS